MISGILDPFPISISHEIPWKYSRAGGRRVANNVRYRVFSNSFKR